MGGWCSCRGRRPGKGGVRIMLVGLDNAGKSRTARALAGDGQQIEAGRTVGFRPVRISRKGRQVHLYDLGGAASFRGVWPHYYADAHGVLFVVDAADRPRLDECAGVLEEVLAHPRVRGKPVLIMANKQDVEGAMDDLDVVEALSIETIVNKYKCPTRVESYSAYVPPSKLLRRYIDPGLEKGFEWLLNYIIHRYDEIDARVQSDMEKQKIEQTVSESKNDSGIQSSDSNEAYESGFENPNYGKREGIIVVQEARSDESGDIRDDGDVQLSPLFGTKSPVEASNEVRGIELEARTHMRKLSPIVRGKNAGVSSQGSANDIFARQLKEFKSQENLSIDAATRDSSSSLSKNRIAEVSLSDVPESPSVRFPSATVNKKLLPPLKLATSSPQKSNMKPEEEGIENIQAERPRSASEAVREQLKSANSSRSRFKLRGLRNNRTNPEDDTSLFIFDPDSEKPDTIEPTGTLFQIKGP